MEHAAVITMRPNRGVYQNTTNTKTEGSAMPSKREFYCPGHGAPITFRELTHATGRACPCYYRKVLAASGDRLPIGIERRLRRQPGSVNSFTRQRSRFTVSGRPGTRSRAFGVCSPADQRKRFRRCAPTFGKSASMKRRSHLFQRDLVGITFKRRKSGSCDAPPQSTTGLCGGGQSQNPSRPTRSGRRPRWSRSPAARPAGWRDPPHAGPPR